MAIIRLRSELPLHTRSNEQIKNEYDLEDVRWGEKVQAEDYKRDYPDEFHRPVLPSRKYNCHGLSFASRRTNIYEPEEVFKILNGDEYQEVKPPSTVCKGDMAVYFVLGYPDHSGIVVDVNQLKVPIILSKWGHAHEVVHRVAHCPYESGDVRYYRIKP
jgi:hypothetical protein